MTTARISDKGQITLPVKARRKLGMNTRSQVEIEVRERDILIKPMRSVRDVRGIFHEEAKGKPTDWKTIREETERIMAEEMVRENQR